MTTPDHPFLLISIYLFIYPVHSAMKSLVIERYQQAKKGDQRCESYMKKKRKYNLEKSIPIYPLFLRLHACMEITTKQFFEYFVVAIDLFEKSPTKPLLDILFLIPQSSSVLPACQKREMATIENFRKIMEKKNLSIHF
ncbi:hypothetical protein OCU04_010202 [Sclerotinia nivalis]|uniref:Uncharacterized protein n=1 Tax=Sclerotinia nivalis TaxID=352851 RepID=A0A9X0DHN0_9HELO|nr:hypothetical protein OCU04_010202 [Sclerotinia nivalis]